MRRSVLFERFAIDVLLAAQTITGTMAIMRTKWEQTWNILQPVVSREKDHQEEMSVPRIGIDEKAGRGDGLLRGTGSSPTLDPNASNFFW